jgi:hypothetical protein
MVGFCATAGASQKDGKPAASVIVLLPCMIQTLLSEKKLREYLSPACRAGRVSRSLLRCPVRADWHAIVP